MERSKASEEGAGLKKMWIDNIAEWTGKSSVETQAMAHNRQEWRELTTKLLAELTDQGNARQLYKSLKS